MDYKNKKLKNINFFNETHIKMELAQLTRGLAQKDFTAATKLELTFRKFFLYPIFLNLYPI